MATVFYDDFYGDFFGDFYGYTASSGSSSGCDFTEILVSMSGLDDKLDIIIAYLQNIPTTAEIDQKFNSIKFTGIK